MPQSPPPPTHLHFWISSGVLHGVNSPPKFAYPLQRFTLFTLLVRKMCPYSLLEFFWDRTPSFTNIYVILPWSCRLAHITLENILKCTIKSILHTHIIILNIYKNKFSDKGVHCLVCMIPLSCLNLILCHQNMY